MIALPELVALAACVGAGLVAGLCFTFAAFMMRALDSLGPAGAIRGMQAINRDILRSVAMVAWMGTAVLGVLAAILTGGEAAAIAGAGLYLAGGLVVTRAGNIPLNEALDEVDPDGADASDAWARYLEQWGRWNSLRTVLIALACASFALVA